MRRILYRKLRRKNFTSAEDFMKQEFYYAMPPRRPDEPRTQVPDLNLSVFEVHPSDDVRTVAEYHGATQTNVSASTVCGLDLADQADKIIAVDDEGLHFDHLRDAHREIRLADKDELQEFAERVYADRVAANVAREDVYRYMASQLDEKDPEWDIIFSRDDRTKFKKEAEKRHKP